MSTSRKQISDRKNERRRKVCIGPFQRLAGSRAGALSCGDRVAKPPFQTTHNKSKAIRNVKRHNVWLCFDLNRRSLFRNVVVPIHGFTLRTHDLLKKVGQNFLSDCGGISWACVFFFEISLSAPNMIYPNTRNTPASMSSIPMTNPHPYSATSMKKYGK